MRVLKLFISLFVVLLFANNAKAQDFNTKSYSHITTNSNIINAINLMGNATSNWAQKAILGDNVSGLPIKVQFKNLASISPSYSNFDALGWKDGRQLYIFINRKHRNAPPEAIASLLSHEAVHQDEHCSLEEETYAWGYEASAWIQMKKNNPSLNQIPRNQHALVDRLNTLEKLFKTANYSTKNIRNVVYTNPGYKGLPIHSPGF